MSFPRYPEYKDSGVEWLGEVPGHWEVRKLSQLFRAGKGKNGQMLTKEFCGSNEGEYPVYSGQTENDGVMGTWSQFEFDFGDAGVLFATTVGAKAMHLRQLFGRFSLSQNCMIIWATSERCTIRFFFYHLQPLFQFQRALIPEHMQASFRIEDLYSYSVGLPPLPEQAQIAAFLDRETAKIDALVAEQRRLMELLKEKRQAVISHAVTRGLNPNAPLKPSGIEWLGDVPEHWELKRLKYLGEAITGLTYNPADIVDDDTIGTLVLRSSNVQGGVVTYDDNVYVSATIPRELVTQVGDILICSRNGSRALIGKNATIDDKSAGLTFGAFMTVFRSQHSAYLSCILNSPLFEFQAGAFMTSTINQLTIGVLNNFEVPFPPENERAEIAAFLAIESAKFNTLTIEAQRAIDLLQERRTALISAAVTGQIDVRSASEITT